MLRLRKLAAGASPPITDMVWIQTGFLGDIVLTTAAIALARKFFPTARQHLVTTGVGKMAFIDAKVVDSMAVLNKNSRRPLRDMRLVKKTLAAEIKNPQATVIMRPHLSYRSALLARCLGYPTITFAQARLSWLAAVRVPRLACFHEAVRVSLLLEPLGVPREAIVEAKPSLEPLKLSGQRAWENELAAFSGKLVGVAPGSNWGTKRWPVSAYTELLQKLVAQDPRVGIVLLGSDTEQAQTDDIARKLSGAAAVWNLAGKTALKDLRRIYPLLSLLITNDSSPIHYASAFSVPTVAVFGATIPEMGFAPLAPQSRVAGIELACRPCSDHGPQVCPLGHFKCMKDLSPAAVLAHVNNLDI